MELKWWFAWILLRSVDRSNRTFMELKCFNGACNCLAVWGSNRTFMELKLPLQAEQ